MPGALACRVFFALSLALPASCTAAPENAAAPPSQTPAPLMTDSLLLKPLDGGRLTSGYGVRYNPISKRRQTHLGIDWAAPRGSPVRAAGNGVVITAGWLGGYGRYVRIDHGGSVATAYAHLDRYAPSLTVGRPVHQGDAIGQVGSSGRATGAHLHYEVLVDGRQIDPLAFAPAVIAHGPQSSTPITEADLPSELAIGGPDTDAGADDLTEPPSRSLALDAIDSSTVIWIKDLLRRRGR
jgi:murein DD-endopeptidase MepM/ murein hydrolase activator NlpD